MTKNVLNVYGVVNILDNAGKSVGTGFFANESGNIVTCSHVLEAIDTQAFKINYVNYIIASSTQVRKAKVVSFDYEKDVAILLAEMNPSFYFKIVECGLDKNESLITIGFPLEKKEYLFSHPIFMGMLNNDNKTMLQLGNANEIVPGFSGAPLINSNGFVVGMINKYTNVVDGRLINTATAISSKDIFDIFKKQLKYETKKSYISKENIQKGIEEYKQFIKIKTDYIGFKGIDIIASTTAKTLKMYAPLYIKNIYSISNSEITLGEYVISERGVIIKGEPGSGKSTFIKYLVRSELENKRNFVPFIISLETLGKYLSNKKINTKQDCADLLIEYILQEYPQRKFEFSFDILDEIFSLGLGWIFFDGFDEIDSQTIKEKIIILINQTFEYWNCKFIITTRPYAINEFVSFNEFQIVNVDILHMEQIEKYINNFSEIVNANQYLIDANGLINIIRKKRTINELARIPVMLTFICLIYLVQKDIPESRYEILDHIIKWLLSTKYHNKSQFEEMMFKYTSIAMDMFVESNQQKEIEADKLYNKYAGNQSKQDFFHSLNQIGIMVKSGGSGHYERYSFWHFCFEEYLTAKALCEYCTIEYNQLFKHWFDNDWKEVILLYSECLVSLNNEKMGCYINTICQFLISLDIENCIKGSGLLGLILKTIYPKTGFNNKSQFLKELSKLISIIFHESLPNITIQDKLNAAIAYGLIGDSRIDNFNETFIVVPKGKYYIGAQDQKPYRRKYDPYATPFETPIKIINFEKYEIRKYPITVEEYEKFILNDGYNASREIWTEEGLLWRENNNIQYPRNWRRQSHLRNSPVTGISWYEATAYCNWLTINSHGKYLYSLPSESQWEYAYFINHNINNRIYAKINCYSVHGDIQVKTPIGLFPSSTSHNGITDMLGNVEEWCADSWAVNLINCPTDGSALLLTNEIGAVTRGGSTIRTKRLCRYTYRARCNKNTRYDTIGFRIIRRENV